MALEEMRAKERGAERAMLRRANMLDVRRGILLRGDRTEMVVICR